MADYMPGLKRLHLDAERNGCAVRPVPRLLRYAKILERVAAAIQSGEIEVPK
jgi:hypothetical protein